MAMDISDKLLLLFYNTVKACFEQILWLWGVLFLIGLGLHFVSKSRDKAFAASVGSKFDLYLTGWIGTPVHEMGHAIFCFIFRHKITEIKFFSPSEDGTLGYVKHEYNPKSSYQKIGKFFIGIAPMFFGAAVIYALLGILLPQHLPQELNGSIAGTGWEIIKNLFNANNFGSIRFWIFVYLSFGIACRMKLSVPDFKGAVSGFITMLCIIFLVNLIAYFALDFGLKSIAGVHWITIKINILLSLFYSIMLYALAVSVIYMLFSYVLLAFARLFKKIKFHRHSA